MGDFPLVLLTATIWTYWIGVGAMIVRLRRRMRKKVGLVPEQRVEQYMWLVWVPLVAAWNVLPWLALSRTQPPLGLPDFARGDAALRGACAGSRRSSPWLSLALTVKCWARMGKDWRMDVSVAQPTTLITDGLFRYIRHPIYAFSMLLMLCTAVIVPTPPMLAVGAHPRRADEPQGPQRGAPPAAGAGRRLRAVSRAHRAFLSALRQAGAVISPARGPGRSVPGLSECEPGPLRAHPGFASLNPGCACGLLALRARWRSSLPARRHAPPRRRRAAAAIDPAIAARILALDCERLSAADVARGAGARAGAAVILLQGSLAFVTMQPFGEFLVAMGYPEERIRNPRDGTLSYGSFGGSDALAGNLAWYYEREGMVPVLIGHSHGGMLVVRTLHELAGAFADAIPVRNPLTDEALPRTTFVDPATGKERPVVGLKVAYASAIATGKLPRLLLFEWTMLPKLRRIPDTAVDFTGFAIAFDLIAFDFGGSDPYEATGTARVRNVTLPASYSHIGIPQTQHLAANPVTRAWIDAYAPGADVPAFPEGTDTANLLHAADIWFSLKKNWCVEAQRSLRTRARRGRRRERPPEPVPGGDAALAGPLAYNAVHVVRVDAPLDRQRLRHAIDAELAAFGLTGFELDRARGRFEYRGGAPRATLETAVCVGDCAEALRAEIERQINLPFPRHRRVRPVPLLRRRHAGSRSISASPTTTSSPRATRSSRCWPPSPTATATAAPAPIAAAPPTCIPPPTGACSCATRSRSCAGCRACRRWSPAFAGRSGRATRTGTTRRTRSRTFASSASQLEADAPRGESVGRHAQRPAARDDPADAVAAGRADAATPRAARSWPSRRSSTSAPIAAPMRAPPSGSS